MQAIKELESILNNMEGDQIGEAENLLAEIAEELASAQAELRSAEKDIASLETRVDELGDENRDLEDKMDTFEAMEAALTIFAEVRNWEGERFVYRGMWEPDQMADRALRGLRP